MLAAWTFGQVMWAMLVFFCWILFFMLLFRVFGDLFSRHDLSGWGKAGWSIFVILLPFLGIFVYLIANGKGIAERNMKQQLGGADRQGEGPARQRCDHPGRVRPAQGEGARVLAAGAAAITTT